MNTAKKLTLWCVAAALSVTAVSLPARADNGNSATNSIGQVTVIPVPTYAAWFVFLSHVR